MDPKSTDRFGKDAIKRGGRRTTIACEEHDWNDSSRTERIRKEIGSATVERESIRIADLGSACVMQPAVECSIREVRIWTRGQ